MGIMHIHYSFYRNSTMQMDVIPTLTEWSKQGEVGQRKHKTNKSISNHISIYSITSYSLYGFNNAYKGSIQDTSVLGFMTVAIVLTAGTMLLLWLGDQISNMV